ncbi:PAS domain S-box protein [Terasakiella sp. SH-1]|uniref:sensor histidine kinase n=1 Tax=Terasakiella sp. SH-1 TaxID=2560057 RepID=UPI0010738F48|nr:PAS domain S-box protein [Terasakiella sp. SH-1]
MVVYPTSLAKKRLITFILIAFFGLFCSVGAGVFVKVWYQNSLKIAEKNWGANVASQIKSEISRETEVLHSVKSILSGQSDFPKDHIDVFMSSSLVRYPHLQQVFWGEKTRKRGRTYNMTQVFLRNRTGVESEENILDLREIDLLVERTQRSRRLLIVPKGSLRGQSLFYAALPVNAGEGTGHNVVEGVLLAQFDFGNLFRRVLTTRAGQMEAIELYDVTLSIVPLRLFSHHGNALKKTAGMTRFAVAGRIFEVRFQSLGQNQFVPIWLLVILLGVVITGLVLVLTFRMNQMAFMIEDGVALQTQDLNQRNLLSRHFLNSTLEAFFALDEKGMIIKGNTRGDELFFGGLESCVGRPIAELFIPIEFNKILTSQGGFHPIELNKAIAVDGRAYDGEKIPLEVRLTEIEGAEDFKWLVICRDITMRMRAEKRLANSDKQFRQAFTLSSVPMAILNPTGFITDSNKSFQKFLGYSDQELSSKPIKSFMHPDMVDEFYDWLQSANERKRQSYQTEQRLLNQAGYNLWVIASFTAVYRFDGSLKHVICQYQDFTDQRYAEQELKLHRDKLKELVIERTREVEGTRERLVTSINAADSAIFVYDSKMNLEFCSDLALEMFPKMKHVLQPGINASEMVKVWSLYSGENEEQQGKRIERLEGGVNEADVRLNDGRWIKISRRKTPSDGTVSVMSDVTAYKKQQELLRIQAEDLAIALKGQQEVNEQQKMFTSVISHEFRTPLAIIDSTVQRIVRRGDKLSEAELYDRLGRIRISVNRLLKLIKSILTAQRLETGKLEYKPHFIEIISFIQEVCSSHTELTQNHNIQAPVKDDQILAKLDGELFELALVNLLNNAEKYSPEGTTITVNVAEQNGFIHVSVEDEGMGISLDDQTKIFDRFFRSSDVGAAEGSGVGLSIVKQIMVLHGGDVTFESVPGKGSKFTLVIPKLD